MKTVAHFVSTAWSNGTALIVHSSSEWDWPSWKYSGFEGLESNIKTRSKEPINHTGCFFLLVHPKKLTKCQITCKSLQKSYKCQNFLRVWHLVIFRADQLKKPPCMFDYRWLLWLSWWLSRMTSWASFPYPLLYPNSSWRLWSWTRWEVNLNTRVDRGRCTCGDRPKYQLSI